MEKIKDEGAVRHYAADEPRGYDYFQEIADRTQTALYVGMIVTPRPPEGQTGLPALQFMRNIGDSSACVLGFFRNEEVTAMYGEHFAAECRTFYATHENQLERTKNDD
jgi:hypothetical protein